MSTEVKMDYAERVKELILADFQEEAAEPSWGDKPLWEAVCNTGSELWLDTGDVDEATSLWSNQFSAVTTNNSLLNEEVQKGTYDELIEKTAEELQDTVPEQRLVEEVCFVLNAYHGLKLSRELGAMVSVELHTAAAEDLELTLAYARRFYDIAPDRFYIKVPLTAPGMIATRRLSREGIPVNFTLGFSARENYLAACVAEPAFVNVFLGRLNSFVADNGLGSGQMVGEKTVRASHRTIRELREEYGIDTRQIAASMREGRHALSLAGIDVLTMPPRVAHGFEEMSPDGGEIRNRVDQDPAPGIDDDVDPVAAGLHNLWNISPELQALCAEIRQRGDATLEPGELQDMLEERGLGGLLPRWTDEQRETVSSDGKIPVYETWEDRIKNGELGLDALMTLSGLYAFASDQEALDERIESLL